MLNLVQVHHNNVDQDSVVGIVTHYRLDGPGIESLGPTRPPIQWVPVSFPGVKWPECGFNHPPPSRTKVKERVELYI